MRIPHLYKTLRIAAVLIVVAVLVNPLPMIGGQQALAAQTPLPSDRRMIQVVDKLAAEGHIIIGSGSWIKTLFGKKFRDPLKVTIGLEPSDFDMRMVIQDTRASPETMVNKWRQAGDKLRELINEEFKDDPAAARKILQSTNLYPPDQLMAGVKSNEEALERCTRYNRVPNLGITNVTSGLDAKKAVGGIYGEGSRASRQFKELSQGTLFGKGGGSLERVIAAEGYEKFTTKGQASVSRQWGEFVQHWLKDGDNKMAGKYIERLANDLDKARDLSRLGSSPTTQELRALAAKLEQGGAVLSQAEAAQLRSLLAKADREAAVLTKLGDVLQAQQRGLLQKVLEALDAPGSGLGKSLTEAIGVIGVDRLLDGLMAAGLTYEAAVAAGAGDYSKIWANASWVLTLPPYLLTEITNSILEAAKDAGFSLTAARQRCDDLMAGIFVPGADATARGYTLDQLVDEIKTEEKLRAFVEARAQQAAARGFEGPATEAADWKSGEAIANKCYPVVLANWQRQRAELAIEYRTLWFQFTEPGVMLAAEPEPAYLDAATKKVTVQVTALSVPMLLDQSAGYTKQNRLKELSEKLIGTSHGVGVRYLNWSPAPDGPENETSEARSFTFTAPGEYEVSMKTRLNINADNELHRWRVSERTSVKIRVLEAGDKPLCGGGPVIKSASRTTLEHEVIPVGPGQVATPGTYINGAGDFSATDPKTGLAIGWQVREGMRYCEGCNCLPSKTIGTFEIAAAGRVKAVIESERNVPVLFTMGSSNTSIGLYFEPKIGQVYGKSVELLTAGSSGTNNPVPYRLEREADVSGPGRISAVIFAPRSSGSFTHACFDQSYTAKVEVLSIGKKSPVNGETKLGIGDHIRTDGSGEAIIVMPWGGLRKLMPNSDLSIEKVPSTSPDSDCQEWTLKLNGGRMRVWSASIEEAEGGGGIQAGPYTVKP